LGLLFNIVPAIIIYYQYGYKLSGDMPPLMNYTLSWTFQCYTFLDNLDGKQARRTGASSPMGMLFDHGCDAITASVVSAHMMKIM